MLKGLSEGKSFIIWLYLSTKTCALFFLFHFIPLFLGVSELSNIYNTATYDCQPIDITFNHYNKSFAGSCRYMFFLTELFSSIISFFQIEHYCAIIDYFNGHESKLLLESIRCHKHNPTAQRHPSKPTHLALKVHS